MHQAQRSLYETARRFGVALTVFHGRGGTVSRAGRRIKDAIMATAEGAPPSPLRMTEAGERIGAKYGLRGIAMRTLEQTVGALLEAAATEPEPDPREPAWSEIMQSMAERSRRAYRELVDLGGEFGDYFRAATPIDVIEGLNLVSDRDRGQPEGATDAGTKRWEFAWIQNRCLMPAWYGFASGTAATLAQHGETAIRELFESWPFARVLIADVELALAKADIEIAERYSALAGPLHEKFFPRIRDEYDRSVELVLKLTGQKELLETALSLRRAIRLRNPYVDPMSFVQVNLLERWRESGSKDEAILKALRASINGIAHGMQNTA
jgi:phosphoenolpyruvate carboxylase